MSQILKGEIYWVNLNPTVGSEISKTRPVLIVSNDINNQHAATVSILPITSTTAKIYPFEVFLTERRRESDERLNGKPIKFAPLINSESAIKSEKSASQNWMK